MKPLAILVLPLFLGACGSRAVILGPSNDGGVPAPNRPGACVTYGLGIEPVAIAGPRYSPEGIAADATQVYFSETFGGSGHGGLVIAVPRGGGKPVVLASGVSPVGRLGVDGHFVYWLDDGANCPDLCASVFSIRKVPLHGGKVVTLATKLVDPAPDSLTVDPTGVYWASDGTEAKGYTDGAIRKVGKDGGKPVTVVSTVAPVNIAFDATAMYWTTAGTQANGYTDGTVMKRARTGGAPVVLAKDQPGPGRGLAVFGNDVYWIDFLWNDALGGTVRSEGIEGGEPVVTLASGQNAPWDLAVDGTGIYWVTTGTGTTAGAEGDPEGTVMGIGFDGDCATVTVADKQRAPIGLTLRGHGLAWIDNGTAPGQLEDGSVHAVGLP